MQERVGHGQATTVWENCCGEFSNTSFGSLRVGSYSQHTMYWIVYDSITPTIIDQTGGLLRPWPSLPTWCAGGKSDALPVNPNDPRWSKFRHRFTGTAIRPFPLKSLGNMTLLQWEWLVDRWRKQKTEENNSHNLRFGCLLPALWYLWPDNPS